MARLGVKDNQFYSSPKCSVLEDAGKDLYSNFGIREEYDPATFSRSKECIVYLASTDFRESRVPITLLLIAEVTPGLSTDCNVYVSSKASFTLEFCKVGDSSAQCQGPGGRNVNYGQPGLTTQINFTDIGDGVILQREIVVNSPSAKEGGGGGGEGGATSSQLETTSSSPVRDYVVPVILAVLIALVLLLLGLLAYCWCQGCFGAKSSRPNTIGSDTMYNEDLIKEAVQKELDNYSNNNNNNYHSNQYTTVDKDGKKMAVINADELEDGLIIVPGMRKLNNCRLFTFTAPPGNSETCLVVMSGNINN